MIDGVLKPELVGARQPHRLDPRDRSYSGADVSGADGAGTGRNAYIELSGTSMSAAVVSGAAALLLEAKPALTPPRSSCCCSSRARASPGAGLIEAGAGSLNIAAAVAVATTAAARA